VNQRDITMRSLVLLGTSLLLAEARLSVREMREDLDPEAMADSKTIKGPDCGHVSQIIGKWQKAKRAGKLAGTAKGTVTNADQAEKMVDKIVARAEKIGKEINDGEVPEGITKRANYAKQASKKAVKDATELDKKITSFKDKVGQTEFSAEKVTSDDMAELKEKTEKTQVAIKAAYEAAKRTLEKANNAKDDALKDAGFALKILKGVLKSGLKLLQDSTEIAQKSIFAADEADETVDKVQDVVDKIKDKADKAKEQKPVFTVLASNVEAKRDSVKDSVSSLKTAIDDMEKSAEELNKITDEMKTAVEQGDAGFTTAVLSSAKDDVPKAEGAVDEVSSDLSTVKRRAKTVMELTDNLKDAMKKAEKKVS